MRSVPTQNAVIHAHEQDGGPVTEHALVVDFTLSETHGVDQAIHQALIPDHPACLLTTAELLLQLEAVS
jgi:hypothetical protein